ncbi:MAG: TlpA family protein disulfide reductase [Candidatus Rokubacteria bacterium]|nr:TlpA family protein disulfide reductase [Candidatus Rokubacteria bacterium]
MFPKVAARQVVLPILVVLIWAAGSSAGASPEAMKVLEIQPPREPIPAPNVALTTLQGKPFSLHDLRGKVVLVNFWATWCLPCQWEMPLMDKLYQAYKAQGFVVVAISLDQEGAVVVKPFVQEKKLTYPVLLDPSLKGARQFGLVGVPGTFLVGRDGFLKGITYGPKEWDGPEARALIESLLRAAKDSTR